MIRKNPFAVIYADDDIIALNKAAGLLTAADRWDPDAPRLDLLVQKDLPHIAPSCQKLYAVHRIDKDTSGVLLYALNAQAHRTLNSAFQDRRIRKTYHALVYGQPAQEHFTIDLPLCADGDSLHRTVIDKRRGKEAVTHCTVLEVFRNFTLLEARPVTGRTHQIRVHLAAASYPIVCDPLYGSGKPVLLSELKPRWRGDPYAEKPLINRLALHAYKIAGTHPGTGDEFSFTAEYAKDFKSIVHQLQKLSGSR